MVRTIQKKPKFNMWLNLRFFVREEHIINSILSAKFHSGRWGVNDLHIYKMQSETADFAAASANSQCLRSHTPMSCIKGHKAVPLTCHPLRWQMHSSTVDERPERASCKLCQPIDRLLEFAACTLRPSVLLLSTHADRQSVDMSFTVCLFVCLYGYGFPR